MDFAFNTKGWTVVDGCDGFLPCAVSLKTAMRGNARPQVLAAAAAGFGAVQAGAGALKAVLKPMVRSLPLLVTLARNQYRLQVMPEPAVPQREMSNSLRWALSTDSEVPLDEFNLSWMRIPTAEQLPAKTKQVYTVTTPKRDLAQTLATLRQAGGRPKVADIRETALRNVCGALEKPGEGLCLLSRDGEGLTMVFTHQGSMYLDRYVEQPSADTRLFERMAVQVMRSVDVVNRSYPFMPISRVVLAPEPEGHALFDYLVAQLPVAVERLDMNRLFDMSRVPELAQSAALQARCLVPLGAALRSAKVHA